MSGRKQKVGLLGLDFLGSCPQCTIEKTKIPELMKGAVQSVTVNSAANMLQTVACILA